MKNQHEQIYILKIEELIFKIEPIKFFDLIKYLVKRQNLDEVIMKHIYSYQIKFHSLIFVHNNFPVILNIAWNLIFLCKVCHKCLTKF